MSEEKVVRAMNGCWMLGLLLLYIVAVVILGVLVSPFLFIAFAILLFFLLGFRTIEPNVSVVVTLCGKYRGTVRQNGLVWFFPFTWKYWVSNKLTNFATPNIKVNDKTGNPIIIGAIIVYSVEDTYLAMFGVEDYLTFVTIQSEGALRHVAGLFEYDNVSPEPGITLMQGGEQVAHVLVEELNRRLQVAGIRVHEARISDLSYATEIAGAMLQRQQAAAVVAARRTIVDGAVGMVELAFESLRSRNIGDLDEDKRQELTMNLLTVLCSEKSVNPVLSV